MGSLRRAILIMVKQPVAGRAKTRLCPPLTDEEAANLAEAFLRDTVANACKADCADVVLAYTPLESKAWFAYQFPDLLRIPQRGHDLGERLTAVFEDACSLRCQPCVVIGTDSPHLSPSLLCTALDMLQTGQESNDVVLGPAIDGGYYLIGLRWQQPALFKDIAWSTDQVLAQTQERAVKSGLRTVLLPEGFDVDTWSDLEDLQQHLQNAPSNLCPATSRQLTALRGRTNR
jgi:rSAM/selenodomain-associated transferase 1